MDFWILTCFAYVLVQQVYKMEVINKLLTKNRYNVLKRFSEVVKNESPGDR